MLNQPNNRRSGIALVMVLGVLSLMVLMAVSFAISMRTERVAAGNQLDTVRVRQLAQVGLVREHHRAQAQPGHAQRALAQGSVVHRRLLCSMWVSCAR